MGTEVTFEIYIDARPGPRFLPWNEWENSLTNSFLPNVILKSILLTLFWSCVYDLIHKEILSSVVGCCWGTHWKLRNMWTPVGCCRWRAHWLWAAFLLLWSWWRGSCLSSRGIGTDPISRALGLMGELWSHLVNMCKPTWERNSWQTAEDVGSVHKPVRRVILRWMCWHAWIASSI